MHIKKGGTAAQEYPDYLNAALTAFKAGFTPIPVLPGTKQTVVKWDPWSADLSPAKIHLYWQENTDHEVGILLNDDIMVCDADTPEGVAALYALEALLGLTSNLIVGTTRGEHHYFRRAKGTKAKQYAPDKTKNPERFDIKTGRALVVIPPSAGKRYMRNAVETVADLVEITQAQIDAIDLHNGRTVMADKPERIRPPRPIAMSDQASDVDLSEIKSLLQHLDPNMGYDDWVKVIMAIFYATYGSDAGLALADEWSSKGSKYKGPDEIEAKWQSLDVDCPNPVGVASLYQLVKQTLGEEKFLENLPTLGPGWDLSGGDTVVTPYSAPVHQQSGRQKEDCTDQGPVNILKQYSLRGQSAQFEANARAQVKILGDLILGGQWSVWYSAPNAGKTMLTLWMAGESIKAGILNPEDVYYVNADDDYLGLTTKLKLAEEYGFHVLAPNHKGFAPKMVPELLRELGNSGAAARTFVILDTLKKFTDPNDKKLASEFGVAVREFIQKGGTLLALSHANKNPGPDGKPKFGGKSDIVDDADCVYTLQVLDETNDVRTVEFNNIKNRGNVANTATYQYSIAPDHGYRKKLASVTRVNASAVVTLKETIEADKSGDTALIDIVKTCISEGVNTKTTLSDEVAKRGNVGKRRAADLIEKYTGTDLISCRWNFTKGERGKQTYYILTIEGS